MILDKPIPFEEAISFLKGKGFLPTTASASELETIQAAIRERAFFSARVSDTSFLQSAYDLINRIVDPGAAGGAPGSYMDKATFGLEMRDYLRSIGYAPEAGKEGGLQDLSSDTRLNLIAQTNTEMAQGYGQWAQGQSSAVLDAFPAQELFRLESRENQRDWVSKWKSAGGKFWGGGRMIALKDDPIWTLSLDDGGFNRFGQPYPPFDYNSGMWIRDISRDEAVEFGLIDWDSQVKRQERDFNQDLQTGVTGIAAGLQKALLASLGGRAKIVDGVLHIQEAA